MKHTLFLLTILPTITLANGHYQTKTPYSPQQDPTTYQSIPKGYTLVFTEMIARHGSRGLSSMGSDLAVENMLLSAKHKKALTQKGEQLLALVQKIEKANLLLGYGVPGISVPGYGNLTERGINEHKALAVRLYQRNQSLFTQKKVINVATSGENRAIDSSKNFVASLNQQTPNLKINTSQTDRYTLYFHKLSKKNDPAGQEVLKQQILQASKAYQKYHKNNIKAEAILNKMAQSTAAQEATQAVLVPLFTSDFLAKLGTEGYQYTSEGERTAISADGKYISTDKGNGKEKINSAFDAASMIYDLYIIAPDMEKELAGENLNPYMPEKAAAFFEQMKDTDNFYDKGPGFASQIGITTNPAKALLIDFFTQAENGLNANSPAAKLRFAHAETIIPFTTLLEIPASGTALADDQPYSYNNSIWRGAKISPMAANIQWDIYNNQANQPIIRMLVNEQESAFKVACDTARLGKTNYYYLNKLKACYLP